MLFMSELRHDLISQSPIGIVVVVWVYICAQAYMFIYGVMQVIHRSSKYMCGVMQESYHQR